MSELKKFPFLVAALLFMVGCSSSAAPLADSLPPATPFPSATPFPTATPLPQEAVLPWVDVAGVEIEIWYVWNGLDKDPFASMIANFNEENTVGVLARGENFYSYDVLNTALLEKLNLAPDQVPNVVLGYPYQYLTWHAFGDRLVDLTAYLTNPELNTEDPLAHIAPSIQNQDHYGAQILGFPAWRTVHTLIYNKTLAQELGFTTAPTTFAEFRTQACAAAQAGAGGWLRDFEPETLLGWLAAAGGQPLTEGGRYNFNSEEMHRVFEFLYQLETEGCVNTVQSFYPEDFFAAREALFYAAPSLAIPYLQQAMTDARNSDSWAAIPFPGETPAVTLYGPSWMILDAHAAGNQAAWHFLSDWVLPEAQINWLQNTEFVSLEYNDFPPIHTEPNLQSWGTVRWALADAANEMLSFGFEAVDIPRLLDQLQATADELEAK